MIERIEARLIGEVPLLLKNGQTADPGNPFAIAAKAITEKSQKTTDDLTELRRIKWEGALYVRDGKIVIPADNVLASVRDAAALVKKKKQALAGTFAEAAEFVLEYDGPKDIAKLYASGKFIDERLVVVQRARIMCVRPRFDQWILPIVLLVNPSVFDVKRARECLEVAGERIGLCDNRPRFGRFRVEFAS